MNAYKFMVIFFCFSISLGKITAQRLDSLLQVCIVEGNFDAEKILREDPSIDLAEVFEKAMVYYKSTDRDQRYHAFLVAQMTLSERKIARDSIAEFLLTFPCQDDDYNIRSLASRILVQYGKSAYTNSNIELLRKVLHDEKKVNNLIILLAGYLDMKEEKAYLKSLIQKKSLVLKTYKKEWAAYLALTRMGEQGYIDIIMDYINQASDYDNVAFNLKYLVYIQHPLATQYIVDLLMGDKTFPADDVGYKHPYSARATEELGNMLKNTPIDVNWVLSDPSQIDIARKWIKNRKAGEPWSYNKDYFWSMNYLY